MFKSNEYFWNFNFSCQTLASLKRSFEVISIFFHKTYYEDNSLLEPVIPVHSRIIELTRTLVANELSRLKAFYGPTPDYRKCSREINLICSIMIIA